MSLYRQATGVSRRVLVFLVLGCLLVGAVVGFAVGRGTAPDPSLAELAAEARLEVRPALSALELVTIEYPQAVRGGEVVAETEYDAAVAQAASAQEALVGSAGLRELDPGGVAAAETAVEELERLIDEEAQPEEVSSAAQEAAASIERLTEAEGS